MKAASCWVPIWKPAILSKSMFDDLIKDKAVKILVVEDEAIIAHNLIGELKNIGFSPMGFVDTGEKAIMEIGENRPDLVILDISIKGKIDGIETAEIIKSRYGIPCIFYSGCEDPSCLTRARRAEPYGYIPKSSTRIDLYTTVRIALQRFRIEQEYRSKDRMLNATLRSISDAVVGLNPEGKIIAWNCGAEKIFGWVAADILNENVAVLVPSYIPNELPGIMDDLIKEGDFRQYDTLFQRKDKKIFNASITISPVDEPGGGITGFSLVVKDISDRKDLEKQIIDILEDERFRIGRDLHDNLGQYLTGILLKLKVLETSLGKKGMDDDKRFVVRISKHVKMVLDRMRELSRGLISLGLQKMSLEEAIQELILFYSRVNEIEILFNSEMDCKIVNYRVVVQLYHITQEAITNALKHASCSRIEIILKTDETDIILSIKDNGKGFTQSGSSGIGLKIMEYRAGIINGHFQIYSNSSGSTVQCSIPRKLIKEEV